MENFDSSMFPTWLIFVLVALSVFGSIVWIKPSPRQQEMARLRQQALGLGIRVQLSKFKGDPKTCGVQEEIECVSYCKDDNKIKKDGPVWCVGKGKGWDQQGLPDGWYWYNMPVLTDDFLSRLNLLISSLPDNAVGIERSQGRRHIYWHEKGGDQALQQINQGLDDLR